MSDTDTLIRVADLQPGDFLDFCDDPIVDAPDHCMACDKPIQWFPEDEWTHTEDPEADANHTVLEAPRDVRWDSEGALIWLVIDRERFDAEHKDLDLHPDMRPQKGAVILWSTDDDIFVLPEDHEVKLIERRGAEAVA